MATTDDGREIETIVIFDSATQKDVDAVDARGEIYRHVLMATDLMRRRLARDLERGTLSPPASRYSVIWRAADKVGVD